jgi:recombination protein U
VDTVGERVINYGQRGMSFEKLLDYVHMEYELQNLAVIEKIPTPVTVLKMERGRIVDGVYSKKGLVDYTGSYEKRPIWFDAKSTELETRFPLSFVHEHQVERLIKHQRCGALCFLLFSFEKLGKVFLMPLKNFLYYWNRQHEGKRGYKSIPYDEFPKYAVEVNSSPRAALDYLKAIDGMIKAEHMLRV